MKKLILIMSLLVAIGGSNFSLAQSHNTDTKNQISALETISESQAVEKAKKHLICHDDRAVDSFGRGFSASLEDSGWMVTFYPSLIANKNPLDEDTVTVVMTLNGEVKTVSVLLK